LRQRYTRVAPVSCDGCMPSSALRSRWIRFRMAANRSRGTAPAPHLRLLTQRSNGDSVRDRRTAAFRRSQSELSFCIIAAARSDSPPSAMLLNLRAKGTAQFWAVPAGLTCPSSPATRPSWRRQSMKNSHSWQHGPNDTSVPRAISITPPPAGRHLRPPGWFRTDHRCPTGSSLRAAAHIHDIASSSSIPPPAVPLPGKLGSIPG